MLEIMQHEHMAQVKCDDDDDDNNEEDDDDDGVRCDGMRRKCCVYAYVFVFVITRLSTYPYALLSRCSWVIAVCEQNIA